MEPGKDWPEKGCVEEDIMRRAGDLGMHTAKCFAGNLVTFLRLARVSRTGEETMVINKFVIAHSDSGQVCEPAVAT